ncbi:MAG: hypothetical protein R2727_04220 [Bacteroidales bacterium]
MTGNDGIFFEDHGVKADVLSSPRIGIDYAGEPWISKPWRFYIPQLL